MGEVIVVTSGKGGVGKTTTVANIGTGLAMLNKKTVVVDTDIGLRNLDVILGLENRIVYNLVDVINGSCRMKQALIKDRRYPDLFLLPSAQMSSEKNSIMYCWIALRELNRGSAMRLPELIRQSLSQLRKFLQFAMRIVS